MLKINLRHLKFILKLPLEKKNCTHLRQHCFPAAPCRIVKKKRENSFGFHNSCAFLGSFYHLEKEHQRASPFSHDTVMQVVLLLDVGMVPTGPLAAFAVVTAEDGGQLLLGHPVRRKRNGALLCQAPTVLQSMSHTEQRTFQQQNLQTWTLRGQISLKKQR